MLVASRKLSGAAQSGQKKRKGFVKFPYRRDAALENGSVCCLCGCVCVSIVQISCHAVGKQGTTAHAVDLGTRSGLLERVSAEYTDRRPEVTAPAGQQDRVPFCIPACFSSGLRWPGAQS